MFYIIFILTLFKIGFQICGVCGESTADNRLKCINGGVCELPQLQSLKFFLLGDSGGLPVYPYVSYAQIKVAKAIAKMGEQLKTEFQISVGDNIYFTGVNDVFDSRFNATFEDVYKGEALSKPWYFIAGNHDHFGNISAQIAYTNHSSRWTFPSPYYKISYKFGDNGTTVDFIMIDTIILCGNTRDVQNGGFIDMIFADVEADPIHPKDPEAAKIQWEWIEKELNNSKADYLFVAGHYPIYSISSHGPSTCLVEKLNPLLKKYDVSAYFSGHDHNLQHLVISYPIDNTQNNITNFIDIHYIVSGAASRSDRSSRHQNDVPFGSSLFSYPRGFNPVSQLGFSNGGFVFVEITDQNAKFQFYNGVSQKKYDCSIPPRTHKKIVFTPIRITLPSSD